MLYAKKFKIIIVKMSYTSHTISSLLFQFTVTVTHCILTVLAPEDDRRSTKTPCFKFKVVIHFLTIHLKSCKS